MSLLNYSRETIKERMVSWLGTAQRALWAQRESNQGESQQGSLDLRQVVCNRVQYLTKVVWRV